ncbi:LOW QUALITY PROTEIN: neprilysin [Rhipicephalus sanguineus]|nr:LOW QUALITY PROTEIN: neprilysin [Rhipicephalus sanguineus]
MSYLDLFVYFYVGPVVPPVIVTPTTTKKGLGHVCRTIRCGIGGTTLFYAINHNVEPCDSMFQYVCERWIHEPSEKYRKVVLGADKHVTDDMYSEMRRLVESYYPYAQSGYALGKLAMLFKGCEDFRERDRNGVGPLNKLRQKYALSDWPYEGRFSGKPEELMAEYIRDTGSGVFVSVRMIPDPDDPQLHARKLIALECSTFVLPTDMLLTYRTTQKEVIKAYKVYISSIVEDFEHGPSEKMVSNIFAFEVNLAHRCDVQCRRKRLKKIKVSEIGQYTDKDSGINWVKVLKTIMTGVTYEITADTMILVRSVSYFKKLGLLFRDGTTKTRAMNYLGWRFMQKFARHTTFKYRNSYKTFQETGVGPAAYGGWMRCLVDAAEAMPLAIGRVYAELMGYEAADYRAVGMMATLQEGLRHMLTEFKWVQGESKEKVFAILSKSSMTVGYPAWLMNDTTLNAYYETVPSSGPYVEAVAKAMGASHTNQLKSSATTTEVFGKMSNFIFPSRLVELHQKSGPPRESLLYDIRSNHFVVPSGVMNPPYYVSESTWSMNFGGLGMLVAKDLVNEFFHAVDAGWMGEAEHIEFKKSADCVLTAIGKSSRTGSADEAVMKCGGLVSDLLALRLSYTAYHAYADPRDETTLPGLEDKSPDQVFFVSAFRTLCTQLRERYYVPIVRGKQKVPELAYLDALMRSMNEFTDAFNCPDGKYRQNVVRECLTGDKSDSASGRLKSRKRALWNPPNASMTSVQTPTDTTPWRTVYKRRYNRTVFKRPLDRTGDAALVRNKF